MSTCVEPSHGADVAGVSPVPGQMWAGVGPVPARMWRGEPTPCEVVGRAGPNAPPVDGVCRREDRRARVERRLYPGLHGRARQRGCAREEAVGVGGCARACFGANAVRVGARVHVRMPVCSGLRAYVHRRKGWARWEALSSGVSTPRVTLEYPLEYPCEYPPSTPVSTARGPEGRRAFAIEIVCCSIASWIATCAAGTACIVGYVCGEGGRQRRV